MNRISAIALLTISSLATCTGAIGQQLKATIPFDFTVGNTAMPAGEYWITSPMSAFIELQRADHKSIATVGGSHTYTESKSAGKLVFARYGNEYFLEHVLCPSVDSLNLDIPAGKAEKRARARSLEAKGHKNGEESLVALR